MKRVSAVISVVFIVLFVVTYLIAENLLQPLLDNTIGRSVIIPLLLLSVLEVAMYTRERRTRITSSTARSRRSDTTSGGDYSAGDLDKRQDTFVSDSAVQTVVGDNTGTDNIDTSLSLTLTQQPARNRRAMLDKMHTMWIVDVLEQSLYHQVLSTLNLQQHPDTVERPLDLVYKQPRRRAEPLPPGTRILDAFDRAGRTLLILGAPGAGKTTVLLELARDLLANARTDDSHPIPVVFPLSSWARTRRPLAEWMIEELSVRYGVHPAIGTSWVKSRNVLPLLDGLDEVAVDARSACVDAINVFQQQNWWRLPIAVSCRQQEYEQLTKEQQTKLNLDKAIVAQPLSREQVGAYLRAARIPIAPSNTSHGWELLDTPLMLNIATLAYADTDAFDLPTNGGLTSQDNVFATYVDRMFQRSPSQARYTEQQTRHYLGWLARQMQQHDQTIFYIERLQP